MLRSVLIGLVGYPLFLGAQVALDKLTNWSIADAFGKTPPDGGEEK